MLPRTREISDALGSRLYVTVDEHPSGAIVVLEQSRKDNGKRVVLDGYGAEVLAGYIMSARLSLPGNLVDECIDGPFRTCLRLRREPSAALLIAQPQMRDPFVIIATFWDRLYGELCVVNAHARELTRRVEMLLQ